MASTTTSAVYRKKRDEANDRRLTKLRRQTVESEALKEQVDLKMDQCVTNRARHMTEKVESARNNIQGRNFCVQENKRLHELQGLDLLHAMQGHIEEVQSRIEHVHRYSAQAFPREPAGTPRKLAPLDISPRYNKQQFYKQHVHTVATPRSNGIVASVPQGVSPSKKGDRRLLPVSDPHAPPNKHLVEASRAANRALEGLNMRR